MTSIQHTDINIELYVFRLLFQVLRPIRKKYNLSINLIMALNSCYLYSKLEREQFYMTEVSKFNGYYSTLVMKRYFNILALRGFINALNPENRTVKYIMTIDGINVINEINQYYNSELYNFSNKYHLDL
jgi:hypothetical protein